MRDEMLMSSMVRADCHKCLRFQISDYLSSISMFTVDPRLYSEMNPT
jgi:hypothetical protein